MTRKPGRFDRSQPAIPLSARRSEGALSGILAADDHHTQRWPAPDAACDEENRELERRVKNFLAQRSIPGLRRLTVEVDGHSVMLRGAVRSYYEKQLAVNCCQRVAGVINVVDAIQVSDSE